ncbi:MAG: serine/threonine protein kinase [Deltaproteobacteria bacterium]|nr:serine/threonine protein kinase [Deltaproteobacteria bacterium]
MATPEQKYRIIDKLDSGGMAEIYRAEAELMQGMKKKVAIKRILPHLTKNQKFVAMFLDEARLSLYLNHANIVHVYDIGRSGQTYFIVMEYVDGMNLRNLCESLKRQDRALEMEHAIFVMMEVCKGLGYAHDMVSPDDGRPLKIVHRDVSPPNILLSRNGEVKLVDFGLAKAASQIEQTDPGVVKGKFSYLSPEAASGIEVDYRADVFAVGIILFELLTGRRLFYGETDYQTVELVRQARVPSLTALSPDIPPDLDQIVRKALARDPDQRFHHAYEIQDALAQFLFARGMKVTSRDLARLVRRCAAEQDQTGPPKGRAHGVIDTLIQEEIVKFTSLDTQNYEQDVGARPLSPDEIGGGTPLNPADLIDPRGWTNEFGAADPAGSSHLSPVTRTADMPDMGSLESMLEGEERQPTPPPQRKKSRGKSGIKMKPLLIALVVFVVLGAATIFVLHTLGLLGGRSSQDNQDIVEPK